MPGYEGPQDTLIHAVATPALRVAWAKRRCWHGETVNITVRTSCFITDPVDLKLTIQDGDETVIDTIDLKVKDPGATIVGQDQAPLGTNDFSSFLLKLRGSNPQVGFITFGGSDLTSFLKQFQQIGMKGKVVISSPIVNDSDLWAAGPQAATGIYPKLWNYSGPYNTPKSQAFAKKYIAKFGEPPEVEAWQDWFGTTAILTAIQKTGSTDSKKLVEFLEKHKFEGFKDMPIYFRSWDHQLIQPVIVAKVKDNITDKYDYFDVLAQFPKGGAKELESFYGTKEEVGCKMGPL